MKKEKILVFMKNWLGDVIFDDAALRVIKKNYPGSELVCLTAKRSKEILEKSPWVDKVMIFDEKREHRHFLSKLKLIVRLREENFEKAFLLHRSFTRALLIYLSGIPRRFGYSTKKRRFLLTKAVDPRVFSHKSSPHQVEYSLELLRRCGLNTQGEDYYEFHYDIEDEIYAEDLLGRYQVRKDDFIVLNTGGNWDKKRWPSGYFSRLADMFAHETGFDVVITGAESDRNRAEKIAEACKFAHPKILCGETDLGELGAIFKMARLVITGDSGPMHIASGVGTRVIALFGPTAPGITGPRGTGDKCIVCGSDAGCSVPCYNETCGKARCMESVIPERVFEKIMSEGFIETEALSV